jgi:myosin heavy subunit
LSNFYNFSGAGKTASAKFIMRYFASVDDKERSPDVKKSSATTSGMSEVEEQIMGMMIRTLSIFVVAIYIS